MAIVLAIVAVHIIIGEIMGVLSLSGLRKMRKEDYDLYVETVETYGGYSDSFLLVITIILWPLVLIIVINELKGGNE